MNVRHERWKCIACAACSSIAPKFWEMSAEDNYADLVDSVHTQTAEGLLESRKMTDISEKEKADLKESQQMCPVECIHVDE